jgi:hypothetical protein
VAIKGQDTTFTINFKQSYLEKPSVKWMFKSKEIITSERVGRRNKYVLLFSLRY